ncbi:hypothetical protein Tsubulata_040693 [Turnera subulata]|uniref:Lipase-like PAD4 n=1 Tax=Turnera subulata TaxID=218843 RepID=A0A9Q0G5L1_9ROSI|nr:hypothetical protein Tsubulata_040693 [Turnera subulata]
METEASSFESSEMLSSFLGSTPLLSQSWEMCSAANANSPHAFLSKEVAMEGSSVGYLAFSGVQQVSASDTSSQSMVPLHGVVGGDGLFSPLLRQNQQGDQPPVMVHAGLLNIFLSFYRNPSFQNQVLALMERSKFIVITGHSIGGTTASLAALWLLSYLHQHSFSNLSILCITFGSPLLGNESLSRAILRERWSGNFCHVVSRDDIMPRLLFAPLAPISPQVNSLLRFWHLSMTSSPHHFGSLAVGLTDQHVAEIRQFVLHSLEELAAAREGVVTRVFWPFGNYCFCSEEGAICVDNATSVVKMMQLLMTGLPSCSVNDHLKYGDYVGKVCSQFLEKKSFLQGELPESSYEAGVALALQSTGISCQEPAATQAKDCLKMARRMGRTPNLNCANLAIKLAKINPYRAEIQWYKELCDRSDNQMGYYDSFKQRGASKRGSKVNMNRHKLAQFWDNVINMMETNQLPHDFDRRRKWVNASQFYMLLVEPLDIAEYYRTGMHLKKGHYLTHGRERRYQIFEKWWKEGTVGEEEQMKRSRFASLTQDTCFWAKVEVARECLDNIKSESDPNKLVVLWSTIEEFRTYVRGLVERKEVSADVVAKNSSYCLWVRDYDDLKSQMAQFRPQYPSFIDGEVVP